MRYFLFSPIGVSLLSGFIGVLAFAPFGLFPLIVLSLLGLLWAFVHATPQQAFRRGFCYGLSFFGAGVYWVYISVHSFGEAPVILSLALTFFLIALLALFPACVGYFLNLYFPENTSVKLRLVFPAIWTLSEWVRSWCFSGFPWLLSGSSQTLGPLKSLASVGSVYLVSFALAYIAGSLLYIRYAPDFRRRNTLIGLIILLVACFSLSFIHWTHRSGTPLKVNLVQGNIRPSLKWQASKEKENNDHYLALSQAHWDKQLVIWPEAAIPMLSPEMATPLDQLARLAEKHDAGLITGTSYGIQNQYYNAAIALGNAHGLYFKRHLVPFGEYFPMPLLSYRVLSWLDIPMSNFKPGPLQQTPIRYKNTLIYTFICYEIIFPEEVRRALPQAGILLLLSDDAWFGHSIAQAQHLQMAQMRAIETGRYLLSVSNNGKTAMITPNGSIAQSLPSFESGVLSAEVWRYTGETPWVRFGSNIYLLLCILSLIIGKIMAKRLANLI